MCDKNLLLVSCIEKIYPCLYNFNLQEYMKKDVSEKAWNEVAQQVMLSVSECKEKWRNLRYSLLRSLKPNADGTHKKKYYLHKSMEFIIPFIKSSKGSLVTQFEEEIDDDMSTHEMNQEVTSPQQQRFEYEFINSEPATKRKRNFEHNQYLQNNQNEAENLDSRRLFMLALMPEINALSEEQMKVFRRKVLALLDDITEEGSVICDNESVRSFKRTQVKPEPIECNDDLDTVHT